MPFFQNFTDKIHLVFTAIYSITPTMLVFAATLCFLCFVSKRIVYSNLARQICQLALIASLIAVIPLIIDLFYQLTGSTQTVLLPENISSFQNEPYTPPFFNYFGSNFVIYSCLGIAGFFLLGLTTLLWRKMKSIPFAQLLMLVISFALLSTGIHSLISLTQDLATLPEYNTLWLDTVKPIVSVSLFPFTDLYFTNGFIFHTFIDTINYYSLIVFSLPFALSVAVAWVLLKRNRDDYGRDYYNFAIKCIAKVLLFFLLCCTILMGISLFYALSSMGMNLSSAISIIIALILLIVSSLIFILIIKSKTPMRFKVAIFVMPIPMLALLIIANYISILLTLRT